MEGRKRERCIYFHFFASGFGIRVTLLHAVVLPPLRDYKKSLISVTHFMYRSERDRFVFSSQLLVNCYFVVFCSYKRLLYKKNEDGQNNVFLLEAEKQKIRTQL